MKRRHRADILFGLWLVIGAWGCSQKGVTQGGRPIGGAATPRAGKLTTPRTGKIVEPGDGKTIKSDGHRKNIGPVISPTVLGGTGSSRTLPPPDLLPVTPAKGVAPFFPRIVPVPPPPTMAGELKKIEKLLSWKDQGKQRDGRQRLHELLDVHFKKPMRAIDSHTHTKDPGKRRQRFHLLANLAKNSEAMHLARYLAAHRNSYLVTSAIRLWRYLKLHQHFIPVAVALLGHRNEKICLKALDLILWAYEPFCAAKAMPFIRRLLLKHQSCIVRRRALIVLAGTRSWWRCKGVRTQDIQDGLADPCPAVQAIALSHITRGIAGKKAPKSLLRRVMHSAARSPYYILRCAAINALAKLKVKSKAVERILSDALTTAALPSITVQSGKGRHQRTFSSGIYLPSCAASTLWSLYSDQGGRFKLGVYANKHNQASGSPLDVLWSWWKVLGDKGALPKVPEKICLGGAFCDRKSEACVNLRCLPFEKAAPAYWKYRQLKHCRRKPPNKSWWNMVDTAKQKAGFGIATEDPKLLKGYLKKKDRAAFKRHLARIQARRCP